MGVKNIMDEACVKNTLFQVDCQWWCRWQKVEKDCKWIISRHINCNLKYIYFRDISLQATRWKGPCLFLVKLESAAFGLPAMSFSHTDCRPDKRMENVSEYVFFYGQFFFFFFLFLSTVIAKQPFEESFASWDVLAKQSSLCLCFWLKMHLYSYFNI